MESKNAASTMDERLFWHKPEVQQLTINLDTADFIVGLQSNVDLAGEG